MHVATLKTELQKAHQADYENKTVQVLVKVKDNAKEAFVSLAHSAKADAKSELVINLENTKNLKKRFEDLLKGFNEKIK